MKTESDEDTVSDIDVTEGEQNVKSDDMRPTSENYGCLRRKQSGDSNPQRCDDVGSIRSKINMRERKRMHDLNVAMDSLREVMPYANGPSVRKLSKIATLSLARNYIQMLTKSVEEMKQLLDEIYRSSVQTRFQNNSGGFQVSVPYRPYMLPLNYGYARVHNASANMQPSHGNCYGQTDVQEQGCSWSIRNACPTDLNPYGILPNHNVHGIPYKRSSREHVAMDTGVVISSSYGNIK